MDKLEQHIKSMKDDLQHEVPRREGMWSEIGNNLDEDQGNHHGKRGSQLWTSFVGLILLGLVVVGLFFGGRELLNPQGQLLQEKKSNEVQEVDFYYAKLVENQVNKLKRSKDLTQGEKDEFLEYINELSVEQKELSQKLSQNIENEVLLKASIANFKQQIKLIEQLLERVESRKLKTYESDGIFM